MREHLLLLAGKKDGKAGPKAKAKAPAPRKLPQTIAQAEAKAWMPPRSAIWVSNVREAWCGHVPPYRRVSTPWSLYGCDQLALKDVLCKMWAQHLNRDGATKDACSFKFDETMAELTNTGRQPPVSKASSSGD